MTKHGADSRSPVKERVRLAWHVLRGRPLMYRIEMLGTASVARPNTWIIRCSFKPDRKDA